MIFTREVFQNSSVIITAIMLAIICIYRVRRYHESILMWLPFIVIDILLIVYYAFVFVDTHVADVMDAGFWSSTLRLAAQIAMTLFVIYLPRRPNL